MIRALVVGDVIGRCGRAILRTNLERIRKDHQPDLVLLNGENAAGGFGLTKKIYDEFVHELGVDVITMGNHWHDKKEIHTFLPAADRLVLPANMSNVPEERRGLWIGYTHKGGLEFAVINLIGRAFMKDGNRSPFDAASRLAHLIPERVKVIFVDMHAEATSEKQAMGHFLKGRASFVYGTHSHVPTADERILGDGTGYTTDVGATGGYNSIIGMKTQLALRRLLTQDKSIRLEPSQEDPWFCAIVAAIDETTGHCVSVERLQVRGAERSATACAPSRPIDSGLGHYV